jgi:5-methylcytosine-specific restriction protein B
MARVRELVQDDRHGRPHPTEVECGWQVVTGEHGERLLQLSTYGSDDRKSEKKVSQTIQLDRVGATQLIEIIRETFGI